MTFWDADWDCVSSFVQSNLTYSCRKNSNNKRIDCLSNDSTVFISILLCFATSSILSITAVSLSKYI